MTRLTARRRHLVIAAGGLIAIAGVISGTVAVATEGSGSSRGEETIAQGPTPAPDKAPGKSPDGKGGTPTPPTTPGAPATPTSNAGRVSPEIVHEAETGGKVVALTIDDGPDPKWTPKVLELLKKSGIKATFCMIGPQAKARPDLVKQVIADGHRLCDHSVDHNTAMDKRSEDYQKQQILGAKKMIEDAAGGGPAGTIPYYRAPGGAFTPYSRHLAADNGMRPLGWDVDTRDWQRPGVDRIMENIKRELPNGPIILFHDGGGDRSQSVEALARCIDWLKGEGYGFGFPKV
ncbi:polysaccharide deacetylase family protein [Streptomyces hesseae]|uniref:Polysaccharide deacetylase family protein n=1 Tax=Streptomyces hesseae TaxID=3075519 RepID=A0ABU2SPX2_9ACTN|nr:polysaccharide deacetylase family protein [Streptomyces sp. DSM 40473]MDT0450925.1 polysaccharide deacetylase family protein [Streptomyces sp. DSM 40473]